MRKILQLVVAIGFPIVSFALTDTIGGITWYYTVVNGKARIGTASSNYGNATSLGKNLSGVISIPAQIGGYEVVGIGQYAFCQCTHLTSVVLPEGLTSIGAFAFNGCSGLSEVEIPVSLRDIGDNAFVSCAISSISIPGGRIGRFAFSSCKNLAAIELSAEVTDIGEKAFYYCGKLTTLTLPSSVSSMGSSVFEGCEGLTNVTICDGVKKIGYRAFSGCTELRSMSLPATLEEFAVEIVGGCDNLSSISVDENNTNLGMFDGILYDKLRKCVLICPKRKEGSVKIPEGLIAEIGYQAFQRCGCITSVDIPQGVVNIGSSAFSSCTGLAEINIPESVRIIDDRAFYGCSGLKTIRIPAGVEEIGVNAFVGCSGLESITIPLGVVFDDNIFVDCNNLVSVSMSFDKRKADQVLFSSYKSLSHVVIPDGSTAICTGAFKGCVELSDICIPRSVSCIGYDAFQGCAAMGEGMVVVDNCFLCVNGGCPEEVVLPSSVRVIADGAFKGQSLKSVVVPNEVTCIGESTFYGCVELTKVILPEHLVEIGDSAFRNCKSLYSIVIPASVKTIAATAFSGSGLKEIFFEGIPPAMSSLELPDGVRVRYNANEDFAKIILAQMGLDYMTPYVPEGVAKPEAVGAQSNIVCVVVSNVVTHYVLNSTLPEIAAPATYDMGFVNIIAEVKGGCVAVPATWTVNYPKFTEKFGSDFTKALAMQTGKKDGAGNPMFVWQDYVAGTDPTDETDVFTASITIVDGKVKVSYSPELDEARKALRKYTTWGKKSLLDTGWTVVEPGKEADYNFFKVTVEMK